MYSPSLKEKRKLYSAALTKIKEAEKETVSAIADVEKHLQQRKNAEKVNAIQAALEEIRGEMAKNKQKTEQAKAAFQTGEKAVALFC